ncbi:MAG: ComF family protein [Synergistaceae bacterium]|nr:ComF family protein [Synergistaceae bacterium]
MMNSITDVTNSFRRHAENFIKVLLHLIWPINCPVCGRPGEVICHECIESLFWDEIITHEAENLQIYSVSFYHTDIKDVILAFKYAGLKSICRPIGRVMGEFLPRPEGVDYIIPVPLHIDSSRKYNQAYELALGLSDIWHIEVMNPARWTKVIPNHAGLNAIERKKLSKDAFRISRDINNLSLVLVDDVCTTGTTLLRLAQVCRDSGARVKCAYTLATVSGDL